MIRGTFWLLALLVLAPIPAAAQDKPSPDQLLKQAEAYYEQLEYKQALQLLIKVQALPDVTPVQKARAFLYMGVCFTALGSAENAVAAFAEVLKIRKNFRMPAGVSPSIRAMFMEALKRLKLPEVPKAEGAGTPKPKGPRRDVAVSVNTDAQVSPGEPIELEIDIDDPQKQVGQLIVSWRRRRGPDFSRIRVKHTPGKPKATVTIPVAALGKDGGVIAYYVEARDAEGTALATAGSDEEPFEVDIAAGGSKKKSKLGWWLVGVGGAVAIAGGIVAAVLLTRDSSTATPPSAVDLTVILR